MLLLDGKKVRDEIAKTLQSKIEAFSTKPKLCIIQIGENEESSTYIRQKKMFGESIGAEVLHMKLSSDVAEDEIIGVIGKLNADSSVHGIIVQLPISEHLSQERVLDAVSPDKDIDGLCSVNVKMLWENRKGGFTPATTKGIMSLLSYYRIPISGKHAVVVGRSALVGKPTALALLNADATVTVAHQQTQNLSAVTRSADILVVAAGKPHFIQRDDVREGQVVIDVGITAVTGEKLEEEIQGKTIAGDVDFDDVKDIVSAISPVPGGVGPMTVASLFENLVSAYEIQMRVLIS
ncbi:MAG: bifunctional 5,10-methylenetetrahydrofolate dehydrogenase/5,10-methenyltetrahydrofolate cyclohydrolase [bacterium]|nr:bifunctional 5,10-methylenetetrahydrofolate dehydrogenase/5,10-methenyltetrahydrofolate cyclohydrolase [bacterium]